MSRLSTDGRTTTEHEDRARILEAEFAILETEFAIDKVNSEDSTIYILKLVSLRLVTLLKIYHIRYICNFD